MYSDFFKLQINPFGETPNTKLFFKSRSHAKAYELVLWAIRQGKGFTLVTGEVGVGKTILSRYLMNTLISATPTALVLNPVVGPLDLISMIREEFKLPAPKEISLKSELDQITQFVLETAAAKRRALLIIDEAQQLSFEALETVRLLSNIETEDRKLLQIVLIGQPELQERMQAPELRQLNQRVNVRAKIEPLQPLEVTAYIKHRIEMAGGTNFLRFDDEACAVIAKRSRGISRLINLICDQTIARAQTKQKRLIGTADLVFKKSDGTPLGWFNRWPFGRGAEA